MNNFKCNILIIDDNYIALKKIFHVICNNISLLFDLNQTACTFDSSPLNFNSLNINNSVNLHSYNFDLKSGIDENSSIIYDFIVKQEINILFVDHGFYDLSESNGVIYKSDNKSNNAIELIGQIMTNDFVYNKIFLNQLVVYTFNPAKSNKYFNGNAKELNRKYKDKIKNLQFIETSPYFNLYESVDNLNSNPNSENRMGSKIGFEKYGLNIGNVLFDFLKFKKYIPNYLDIQYNYFEKNNLDISNFLKHINKYFNYENINIGFISFSTEKSSEELYLIDSPYKEYYLKYDKQIKEKDYFNIIYKQYHINENENNQEFNYSVFLYKKIENEIIFSSKHCKYDVNEEVYLDFFLEECDNMLPYFHTAVFYEPDKFTDKEMLLTKKIDIENSVPKDTLLIWFNNDSKIVNYKGRLQFLVWKKVNISINDENNYIESIKSQSEEIFNHYFKLIKPKAEETLIPKFQEQIQTQALRSAISQVLARNMSHNIGSHVMNALVNTKYLENFCSKKDSLKSYKPNNDFDNEDEHKTFNQIAIYNNYVKCRMDYLADITFGVPAMLSTINVYQDLFLPLDRVRLLLDNISGRSNKFKYKIEFKRDGIVIDNTTDFSIAMPNDVLGCQAFYNIIENVIRNTAKHAKAPAEQIINFTVNFRDIALNEVEKLESLKNCYQSYYCVEIYDDIEINGINKLIISQNEKINDNVLTNENVLRSTSLGMVEMDASAAYIRQMDIVNIDNTEYDVSHDENLYSEKGNLNIIKAFAKEGKYLGYRFFIKKPQEVLIVTENTVENANDLINEGVLVETINTFVENLNKNHIYNYNFIVIDCQEKDKISSIIANKEANITKRIFYKTRVEIEELFKYNKSKIIEEVWRWQEKKIETEFSFIEEISDIFTPINISININGESKSATFDSHFEKQKEESKNAAKETDEIWNNLVKSYFYYECLSSKGESKLPNYYEILNFLRKNKLDSYISNLLLNREQWSLNLY
jgi:hypothetical protein